VLGELNGKPGYYIEMFSTNVIAPSLGKDQFSVSVLDRTAEMKAIDDYYYAGERSSLIKKQLLIGLIGLIGLVLALAICLVGLRLLTRHYITRPIDELQQMSRALMEGKLDAEVVVDEKSDFADLQRLLQSGKLLISKMDEIE
jgi:nitrate/nitrite-specific signal transduction histidine kinase